MSKYNEFIFVWDFGESCIVFLINCDEFMVVVGDLVLGVGVCIGWVYCVVVDEVVEVYLGGEMLEKFWYIFGMCI